MIRALAALAGGSVLGIAVFAAFAWAFGKGFLAPIEFIIDRDTLHHF